MTSFLIKRCPNVLGTQLPWNCTQNNITVHKISQYNTQAKNPGLEA